MAEPGYVSFKEFNETVNSLRKGIQENEKKIIELKVVYEALSGLPKSIQDLSVNMALVQQGLEQLNSKFDKFEASSEKENSMQNQKITKMNEKSKIDIMEIIRDNWFKVVLVAYILIQTIGGK